VTIAALDQSLVLDWLIGAALAFGVAFVALRYFKVSPFWALLIGMLVFTGLHFPIGTYATKLVIPRNSP
jgi:hypothetical protein